MKLFCRFELRNGAAVKFSNAMSHNILYIYLYNKNWFDLKYGEYDIDFQLRIFQNISGT